MPACCSYLVHQKKAVTGGGGGGGGLVQTDMRGMYCTVYTQIPEHPAWNLLSFLPPSETNPFGEESMIHMMKYSCIHVVRSMREILDFGFFFFKIPFNIYMQPFSYRQTRAPGVLYSTCMFNYIHYSGLIFFLKSVDRSYLYVKIWYLFFYVNICKK